MTSTSVLRPDYVSDETSPPAHIARDCQLARAQSLRRHNDRVLADLRRTRRRHALARHAKMALDAVIFAAIVMGFLLELKAVLG